MQQEMIEGYRLSPQQKHLWLLQKNNKTLPFLVQFALLIEGKFEPKLIETALQNVVDRHEIFRTTFPCLPGMTIPLQVIVDRSTLSIDYYDVRNLTPQTQEAEVEALFNRMSQLPLDVAKGTLLHVYAIALSPHKQVWIVRLPAMNADTATVGNLVQAIARAYTTCLQGEDLDDEPMQYADFAEWQNELLESEETEAGRDYWQRQDVSAALTLKLPFQKVSPLAEFKPKYLQIKINQYLVTRLEELAHTYDTSIYIVLLSCWQVLLWRLTGKETIVVASVFEGRKYEELEQALGLFAKYLPLACNLNETAQLSEIIKQVRETFQDVYKWQEYFTWETSTDPSEKPLFFPLSFEFEERPEPYGVDGVSFSILRQYVCFDRFNVKLSCIHQQDTLTAEFHYDSTVLDEETINRLATQFQTLLENAINYPESAIAHLEILNKQTRQQLLIELNQTQTNYSPVRCIHHWFEQQATISPDSIAVVFENQQITYAELNKQANQIAHYLQQLGVEPEVRVGLFVERSIELIVGLLGILKAGGAYLPLDPVLPTEGLAFRLQDAQATVLLTQQHLVERLPECGVRVVCLDADWDAIASENYDNPVSPVVAENLAYVLFTSGSTGKPKGVAVEHQQLFNYLNAILEKLDLLACTSFATVSTFAADLGNTTIFASLCTGGCLHIVSQERAANPEALADYFHRYPIDCLKIVPSHLAALLTCSHPEHILPRQRLILGGEVCSWHLIEQIREFAPQCQMFNHYGPTEATVGTLTYSIQPEETGDRSQTVPIGRAIANAQVYLLDSYLQPVPIGVPGELYIGGAGLARGYLNQPELTAERFITNPFKQERGRIVLLGSERLYKTGDLARYLPNGDIEYLGRIDHQVKIHGFRIELGEIEAVLSQHPAVRETVVLVREDRGNPRLVAYVVPQPDCTLTTNDLRGFLQEKLPEYMIPSAFVRLKALPLTPNGKVDRQALPAPDLTKPEWDGNFVAPRTSVEKILAELWRQILRLEKVGINDNFFELGGDSILSMQVVAKANQAGLQLTPKQLFECQTIAELAAVVGTNRTIQAEQGLVTGEVPLTPIQHWFFEQNLPEPHHWNQAILLEVRQTLDPLLLEQTLEQLLAHHDALRLRFIHRESGWHQVNANSERAVPLTRLDLSALSPDAQDSAISVAATELQASLNLSEGPLVRVALFDLGAAQPNRLLFVIHHLAVDGVSWRILLEDFQTVYEQLSQGETICLPAKTTSFQQWAKRLREYAHLNTLQQELDYWLTEPHQQIVPLPECHLVKEGGEGMAEITPTSSSAPSAPLTKYHSPLPVDFSGGDNTVAEARTVSVALSLEETQALLQEVPSAYQTQINDVLLTALVQAYTQWTGTTSLLIDLEGHGREDLFEDIDLSRTVGWFTTIFPVFLDLADTSHPGEALHTIKEQLRSIPNRGIGYSVLRYLSNNQEIAEQLQALPQAEIRFNYLGQSDSVLSESSLFGVAPESSGSSCSLRGRRRYLLDISGMVIEGRLKLDWTYSENVHRRATIEGLAESFVEALRSTLRSVRHAQSLIAHCQFLKLKDKPLSSESTNTDRDEFSDKSSNLLVDNKQIFSLFQAPGFISEENPKSTIQNPKSIDLVATLNADAVLDPTIRPEREFVQPTAEPTRIFLTGATGFVGAFLLNELLQQTQADIYCLVRSPNAESGKARLQHNLESYWLWNEALSNRIIPVVGDLSQPLLGLSPAQFQHLASEIDVIYHNGAAINLVYPYSTLKASNVLGTQEVLRLASQIQVKPVHYISTLSVLSESGVPYGGYAQTKWVAEQLVTAAGDRTIPTCIYRLGRVSGHSQTGVCNTNDRLYRMIKGFIQLGCAPDADATVDMTPVDYVSRAIVHLSKQNTSLNRVFHISNPHPIHVSELVNWIRLFGYPLQQTSNEQWQAQLLDAPERFPDNPLYPLMPFFAGQNSGRADITSNSATPMGAAEGDRQNALDELTDTSILCPLIDAQLLNTYFSYLIQSGFLQAPPKNSGVLHQS